MDVRIHRNLLRLKSFTIMDNKEAIAEDLSQNLKGAILHQFGVATTTVEPGSSTEVHKEPEDKHAVKQILCHLQYRTPVMFSDEVDFILKSDATGPYGTIDLIVGKQTYDDLDKCVIVKHGSDDVFYSNSQLAETKKAGTPLARHRLREELEKASSYVVDKDDVAQPVAQLLSVGYRFQSDCQVLFYACREYIRPFIYFPQCDLMLTTDTSYRWCNTEERKLELMGVVLMAVMCETSKRLKLWNMAKASSSLAKITKTGFVDAVKKAKQKNAFLTAKLRVQSIQERKISRPPLLTLSQSLVATDMTDEILQERERIAQ